MKRVWRRRCAELVRPESLGFQKQRNAAEVKIILGAVGEIGDADREVFARLTVTQQEVDL